MTMSYTRQKCKTARNARMKLQSAMEYLMTYGWAILVIAVVLGVLYSLGIFSPSNFAPKAQPGSCQVFRPNGPGTSYDVNLEGTCSGELPEYVATFSNSYIQLPASITTSLKSFTASAWVNPAYINEWNATLGFKNSSGDGWEMRTRMGWGSSSFRVDTSSKANQGTGVTIDSLNIWYFETFTYNYTTGTAVIWYNANTSNSEAINGIIPTATTVGGIGYGTIDRNFGGYMSNVQIYNTTLDHSSVEALYQEGIGGAPIDVNHLVGWWPLNGNANDYSGNNNNGVPTNVIFTGTWGDGYTPP